MNRKLQAHAAAAVETLSNLGLTLIEQRRFEEAEETYREAVELSRFSAEPENPTTQVRWAQLQNNLGLCLRQLGRLREAEQLYREVVVTRRHLARLRPEQQGGSLATALMNLGNLLAGGNRHEEAIVCHLEAMRILTPLAKVQPALFARDLLRAQNNLANSYSRGGRLHDALDLYESVVAVRRRWFRQEPVVYGPELADGLANLGSTYAELGRPKPAETAFREALSLLDSSDQPDELAHVLTCLGELFLGQGQPRKALEPLTRAAKLVDSLRLEALTLDRRLQVMRRNVACFDALTTCLVRLGQTVNALAAAERGRGRSLADLLAFRESLPQQVPPEIAREYGQLLVQLRNLEESAGLGDTDPDAPATEAKRANQVAQRVEGTRRLRELTTTVERYAPNFRFGGNLVDSGDIAALARSSASILIQFRVTPSGSFVFLAFPSSTVRVVEARDFTLQRLQELLIGQGLESSRPGWLAAYVARIRSHPNSVSAQLRWERMVVDTLATLYKELLHPVHEAIQREIGKSDASLVLIPSRGLALFPLHACNWGQGGRTRYLLDGYSISYAPSLTLYRRCREQRSRRQPAVPGRQSLLAVANPSPGVDLPYAEWECACVRERCRAASSLVLAGLQPSLAELQRNLPHADVLHFACHAQYRPDAPLASRIDLAGGESLSLAAILEQVALPRTSLVTLSACESSLVDFREVAEEHFGLPLGFLVAGASTVYGSLWSVPDQPTALLMKKLYERLAAGDSRPEALRQAQRWLRDATILELVAAAGGAEVFGRNFRYELEGLGELQPYAHPYNWAAFQCVGAE